MAFFYVKIIQKFIKKNFRQKLVKLFHNLKVLLKEKLFLKKGGNENYKNIINQYHVITIKDLNLKYRSKFAYYYRKHLENIVNLELNPNYKIE